MHVAEITQHLLTNLAVIRRFVDRELEVVWDRRLPHRVRGLSDNYITVYAPARDQQLGALARVRPLAPTEDGLLCA